MPQPLPGPVRERPRRRGLGQTRERLMAGPVVGVFDGQVPPMRRSIRIGAAATLEVDGVTVQPDHRRTDRAPSSVGEGRVEEASQHRPLVQPAHLTGVERSEVEMLSTADLPESAPVPSPPPLALDRAAGRGCRRPYRPPMRPPGADPQPAATVAVGELDGEEPAALVHRFGSESVCGPAGRSCPARCPRRCRRRRFAARARRAERLRAIERISEWAGRPRRAAAVRACTSRASRTDRCG